VLHEITGLPHIDGHAFGYGSAHAGTYASGTGWWAHPPGTDGARTNAYSPQDWGRKYLSSNGGCVYIDLDHVEACIPEVVSAYDHVAAWHAMLRIVRRAQAAATARLPAGQRIQMLVNNSDGRSHSYGSHLNFLITRRAWESIFHRKLHYQLFLAAFQASSIIITGQGKVGSENGAPPVAYQLAQRADFLQTLCGPQTTYNRPLVNSRDEPLCGSADALPAAARLHCIFFDNTMCQVAGLLKVGLMQILLAMIEAEQMNPRLLLEDPVDAVQRWSHDPTLRTRAPMVSNSAVTALDLQSLFLEDAKRFVEAGGCDGIVPHVHEIMQLWEDTLRKLAAGDLAALTGRLDWVLKLHIVQRAMRQRPHLTWASPEIKVLDHLYSSLDPADGLYWAYESGDTVERVVSDERIGYFEQHPPEDTRAWTRAMLLRCAAADQVESVDWDGVVFKTGRHGYQRTYRHLELPNPLASTKAETEHVFQDGRDLNTMLDELGASAPAPLSSTVQYANAYSSGGYVM
jgi:proteasome accessory factor A